MNLKWSEDDILTLKMTELMFSGVIFSSKFKFSINNLLKLVEAMKRMI
jgi:hypothetical protein